MRAFLWPIWRVTLRSSGWSKPCLTAPLERICRTVTRLSLAGGLAGSLAGAAAGCGSIEPVAPHEAPITDPTRLYSALTIDYPAVNLSTAAAYSTQQLTATPRDALGGAMADLPAPTFESRDTTKVRVTANGLLTAVSATSGDPVTVIARLAVGPVTHVDTAHVEVTTAANPPVLATLSVDPISPDSGLWPLEWETSPEQAPIGGYLFFFAGYYGAEFTGWLFSPRLIPLAADPSSAPIDGLAFTYASLDPAIATIDRWTGLAVLHHPGQVRLVARTMAYGIAKADTATFTVTWPSNRTVYVLPTLAGTLGFTAPEIKIRSSGVVIWLTQQTTDTVDVTFDDLINVAAAPSAVCDVVGILPFVTSADPRSSCGSEDVILLPGIDVGADPFTYLVGGVRQFPVPGVYTYHSARTGATGRIVVTDDPT